MSVFLIKDDLIKLCDKLWSDLYNISINITDNYEYLGLLVNDYDNIIFNYNEISAIIFLSENADKLLMLNNNKNLEKIEKTKENSTNYDNILNLFCVEIDKISWGIDSLQF